MKHLYIYIFYGIPYFKAILKKYELENEQWREDMAKALVGLKQIMRI